MTRTYKNCAVVKTCKKLDLPAPKWRDNLGCEGSFRRRRIHTTCEKCPLCTSSKKYKASKVEEATLRDHNDQ